MATRSLTGRMARLAVLLAAALVLQALERLVPSPFPFMRIGLANIVTVFVVLTSGLADALVLTVLRVTIGSALLGAFLGPSFALGLPGGAAAAIGMALAARLARPPLGVVGVSLVGALCHNLAQLAVVAALYTGVAAATRLVPAAILVSAAAGLGTGVVASVAIDRIRLFAPAGRAAEGGLA